MCVFFKRSYIAPFVRSHALKSRLDEILFCYTLAVWDKLHIAIGNGAWSNRELDMMSGGNGHRELRIGQIGLFKRKIIKFV